MLCKFKVKGYKGFQNEIVFDLENHNDYQFNKEMIKDGVINKSIIYGNNASGKTNLGLAIFDLTFHLIDKSKNMDSKINTNYLNLNSKLGYAEFYYEFKFDNDRIIYRYKKKDLYTLLYEEVIYNGKKIIAYDFFNSDDKIIEIEEAKTLNFKYNLDLSIVKYICNNTIFKSNVALSKLMEFVNGMLWFRSVDSFGFIGLENKVNVLDEIIIENKKTNDFKEFLHKNNIDYDLIELKSPNGKLLGVKMGKNITTLESLASSGTKALWLYYCWNIYFSKVKFLFIDEFDATYHFDLAANILETLNSYQNFQSVLTSHNTYLMSNRLTRPDCSFIITPNSLNNLSSCTNKELREAHNIEKLYREGVFN